MKKIKEIVEKENSLKELIKTYKKTDDTIENFWFKSSKILNDELYSLDFSNNEFDDTDILETKSDRLSFTDCIFKNCNFSNSVFENSNFVRCKFENCKLTGCLFLNSRFYNVDFYETNGNFSNFTSGVLENVKFEESIFRNSYFQEDKFKKVTFYNIDLTQSQFLKTKLNNIDFSKCTISGIVTYIEDLKGAIINEMQAVELIGLLGVKISDN